MYSNSGFKPNFQHTILCEHMKSVVCIIIQEKNNTTKMWLKLATPCTAAQVTYYSITLTMVQMFPIQFYICQKT